MAVARQFNFLGQARVDVPHLRLLESGVAGDFDALAGKMLAGGQPAIVSGFYISTTNAYGAQAKALKVVVSNAAVLHYGASESGTVFTVPNGTAPETLDPSVNTNVNGSFAAGATNYVGLDLIRTVNDATADLVQFMDATTKKETPKSVALARTLNYRFIISTKSFASSPNIAPMAIVAVDANGNVTAITDARKMMFRLGSGGDVPNQINPFTAWGTTAGTRKENPITSSSADPFSGGDKGLSSFKDWMNGVMTRLWEIGGGEYWYSPTADRDVILTRSGAVLDNGDYLKWDGTNLTWQGLSFVFSNSTGNTNQVKDFAAAVPGTTDLAVGDCVYADLDRTQNLTGVSAISPVKGSIAAVGPATTRPGSRIVLAWRTSSGVFARGLPYPVGTIAPPATNVGLGIVKLASAYSTNVNQPEVPTMDASSASGTLAKVLAGGLTRGTTTAGNINIGTGANDNTVNLGRAGQSTAVAGLFSAGGGAYSIDASGNVTAASFSTAGASSAASFTATGLIKGNSFQNTAGSWTVSSAGAMVAASLSVGAGALTAGSLTASGNVSAASMSLGGTALPIPAYAFLGLVNSGGVLQVPTTASFTTLAGAGYYNSSASLNATASTASGTITVTNAGVYDLSFGGSLTNVGGAQAYSYQVLKNGTTVVANTQNSIGAGASSFTGGAIVTLAAGDSLVLQWESGSTVQTGFNDVYFKVLRVA